MAELAYAQRLGRCPVRVRGSNPLGGINEFIHVCEDLKAGTMSPKATVRRGSELAMSEIRDQILSGAPVVK